MNVRAGRVRVAKGAPAPAVSSPPLPQVGIVPGTATAASGEAVDVAALGPDPQQPLFSVRMVLPIPPDSETDGTASLTGLDPATMWHSHSPVQHRCRFCQTFSGFQST